MGQVQCYYVNKSGSKKKYNQNKAGEMEMSIRAQAERIGFQIVGELTRCIEREPTHLYQCYFDEAQNEFILRRGILTIVAADGKVF